MAANNRTGISWVAALDLDEFVHVHAGQCFVDFMANRSAVSSLAVNWRIFSHGGHSCSQANRLVLEAYPFRWAGDHPADRHIKTISRVEQVTTFQNPHYPKLRPGFVLTAGDGHAIDPPGRFHSTGPSGGIELRHYHTKSAEEYAFKQMRGNSGADGSKDRKTFSFHGHTAGATFRDRSLEARWLPALRHVLHGESLA